MIAISSGYSSTRGISLPLPWFSRRQRVHPHGQEADCNRGRHPPLAQPQNHSALLRHRPVPSGGSRLFSVRGTVSDGGPVGVSWAWGVTPVRLFLCARFGFWFLQKIELGGLPGCLGSVFDGTVVRLALLVPVCVWLLGL